MAILMAWCLCGIPFEPSSAKIPQTQKNKDGSTTIELYDTSSDGIETVRTVVLGGDGKVTGCSTWKIGPNSEIKIVSMSTRMTSGFQTVEPRDPAPSAFYTIDYDDGTKKTVNFNTKDKFKIVIRNFDKTNKLTSEEEREGGSAIFYIQSLQCDVSKEFQTQKELFEKASKDALIKH